MGDRPPSTFSLQQAWLEGVEESPETPRVCSARWLILTISDDSRQTDILLVRMTSDSTRPPEKRYNYRNALSGLICLIREEGIRGLGRGLGTNTVRLCFLVGSRFFLILAPPDSCRFNECAQPFRVRLT